MRLAAQIQADPIGYAKIVPMGGSHSVSQLLAAWGQGDRTALEQLTPQVYGELHKLACAFLRGKTNLPLQPTTLINEAFVRLLAQNEPARYENRAHFFGIAARLMRLILVDELRARQSAKRGAGARPVTLKDCMAISRERGPDVLEVDQALTRLAEVDERKARVIEMRYFAGMEREEVAEALGLTVATVKRDISLGEAWLRRFLASQE